MAVSAQEFRAALGAIPAGVTVITSADPADVPVGATVSAFCSLSLAPPLVLLSLTSESRTARAIRDREAFAAHIIGVGQESLAFRFASADDHKFSGLQLSRNSLGVPVLEDCPLRIECTLFAEHPGGDHIIVIGEVQNIVFRGDRPEPIAWFERGFRRLDQAVSDEVRASDHYGQFPVWLAEAEGAGRGSR
jgi:flavin reductase (DIM6/NTAB) family NADH-FMN oxidoreductase RutF